MSTSYIAIYKTEITVDKNAKVDSLEDYLDTCTKTYENNAFQYNKTELELSVKIVLGQNYTTYSPGNYCKIRQDAKNFYYFIIDTDWISESVIKLNLKLDTINTYNGEYNLGFGSKVIRRHKDRFYNPAGINGWAQTCWHRLIDKTSEGINPILYNTADNYPIEDKLTTAEVSTNFYLVYRTPNNITESNQALECALVSKDQVVIGGGSAGSVTWTRTDFTENKIYYYFGVDNPSGKVNCAGTDYTINDPNTWFILFKNNGSDLKYKIYNKSGGLVINWTNTSQVIFKPTSTKIRSLFTETLDTWTIMNAPYQTLNVGQRYLAKLDSIDRTDTRICKIIELPYLPSGFEWTEDTLTTIPAGWTLNGKNELILTNPFKEFERQILKPYIMKECIFLRTAPGDKTQFLNTLKQGTDYESKLYHSDFYNYKLLYDNFNTQICLENINRDKVALISTDKVPYLSIYYKQSNQVSSNLAFAWEITASDGTTYHNENPYQTIGDYDDYIISTRNNEISTLTNTYLDYMRNNYNYDQKNATRSAVSGFFNVGSSVVQGAVSGSLLPGAGTAAGAIVGAVTGTINAISNTINGERSLQQKQDQLASQATTVAGANDLDLLNWYSENKLWKKSYEPSEEVKKQLWYLFRNYGYATDEIYNGTMETNRVRFNFIQADVKVEWVGTGGYTFNNDIIEDITKRYAEGITIYHRVTEPNVTTEWDFRKEWENWETSLLS